ncbi:MAG TPA: hypothetical protein VD816_16305 [Ohtaekwangia sp.]|nr:hypothetical protein [Ohtaekwangia sp.]
MSQQQIIFESSPAYIFVCLALAAGLSLLLYRSTNNPWGRNWNRILLVLRFVLSFLLMFLLLGPIVRQINNVFEKPNLVVMYDNSASIGEATDSATLKSIEQRIGTSLKTLEEKGFAVAVTDLDGDVIASPVYSAPASDISNALKKVSARYEGKKIDGVVLISDGIYNGGVSPLYASYNFPVYAVGVGDTLQRTDVGIKNVAYNKIAYEGNKFPLRVEVAVKNLSPQPIRVSLVHRGKVLEHQTKTFSQNDLLIYDFQPLASEKGIQKIDVQVDVIAGESNVRNNRSTVYVEVVEGKKKILFVAPSPHPDIKALREVIEKNSNYEFLLHVPGVEEQQPGSLQPAQVDLAIFHQAPDKRGKTRDLFQKFMASKTSMFFILGQQSDIQLLGRQNAPVRFETLPREFDEVTPAINSAFPNFSLSAETSTTIAAYPPIAVHFGRMRIATTVTPLLYQRVGSLATEKPLLAVDINDNRKIAMLLGEGVWRWRLNEFDRTESTAAFDEIFGKMIQFLCTSDDRRRFRSYPVKQEFSNAEPVIFESQVYNDLFEPVYGNTIKLDLTHESGAKTSYAYVTSPGNTRYEIGGLKEGVYRYRAGTDLQGKAEEVRGEFAVVEPDMELQNLTADFDLLRKLSSASGGRFYAVSEINDLQNDLLRKDAKSTIHTEEAYRNLLNLKWVFWLLLLMISLEWFARKFHGSY